MGDQNLVNQIVSGTPAEGTQESSTLDESTQKVISGEETPTPESEQPPQEDKFASRFAALSKKEKAILERERQIKAELEEIRSFKKQREESRKDPLSFLKQEGFELEDILHSALGSKQEPTVEDKIKQLQERLEQKEREEKEREEAKKKEGIEQAYAKLRTDIKSHIETNEALELLRQEEGGINTVVEVMEAWLQQHNELLPLEEACKKVEEYFEKEIEKFVKTKKLSTKLGLLKENPAEKTITAPTLGNKQTTETAAKKFLSDEESRREAAKLLKWN